jgi:SAM-dependent methyltransferase
MSLELIEALRTPRDAAVVDIGGGASRLVDCLVDRGFGDLTVLDVSVSALEEVRSRLGDSPVFLLHEDLLDWQPDRQYDLWHDRAVFHFLVTEADRQTYLEKLREALRPGGSLILGTFALDGPEVCSGLPVTRYSADDLSHMLGSTFEPVQTRRELHTTPRGSVQPFTWLAGRIRGRGDAAVGSASRLAVATAGPAALDQPGRYRSRRAGTVGGGSASASRSSSTVIEEKVDSSASSAR